MGNIDYDIGWTENKLKESTFLIFDALPEFYQYNSKTFLLWFNLCTSGLASISSPPVWMPVTVLVIPIYLSNIM
jgi:hypothetical protein